MSILLGLSDMRWVSWNPPHVLALAATLPLPQIHSTKTSTHLISPAGARAALPLFTSPDHQHVSRF